MLKLLDFGLCERSEEDSDETASWGMGTVPWKSPETLQSGLFSPASDWWAVGVIFFEMRAGHLPFRGRSPRLEERIVHFQELEIPRGELPWEGEFGDVLASLLASCEARASACQLRRARFFRGVDFATLQQQPCAIQPIPVKSPSRTPLRGFDVRALSENVRRYSGNFVGEPPLARLHALADCLALGTDVEFDGGSGVVSACCGSSGVLVAGINAEGRPTWTLVQANQLRRAKVVEAFTRMRTSKKRKPIERQRAQ